MLSHIDQVDLFNKNLRLENGLPAEPTLSRVELFRQFLYFDAFHATSLPVIVCEGPTDNIYLKHAIRQLAASHPLLAFGSPPEFKIRLFKYGQRRSSEITQLTGGVGGICHLLKNYHSDFTKKIKAPFPVNPVIVLIDNDAGAKGIYGAISGITKELRPTGTETFIHVFGNLYVVATPLGANESKTSIEDFFDSKTLTSKLGTKSFSRAPTFDVNKHFGKTAFAREIVEKNADSIDFRKFSAILSRIEAAIADYAARRPRD